MEIGLVPLTPKRNHTEIINSLYVPKGLTGQMGVLGHTQTRKTQRLTFHSNRPGHINPGSCCSKDW